MVLLIGAGAGITAGLLASHEKGNPNVANEVSPFKVQ